MTFEEANKLLRMECKDIPHGDQLVMGLTAFGCEYAHNICGKCNNRFNCEMQGVMNVRQITKCNYFERG